jgi:cytochrome c oxidase assembly protein subunit 15
MLLIAGAATLQFKVQEVKLGTDHLYAKLLPILAFMTLIAGTIVTGSGPHAGDWQAPRFHFALQNVAKLHGAFVAATLALTIYIALKMPRKSANWLLVAIFGQGLIGLLQWWQGLPQYLVAAHLLGAALFWFATWRVRLSFKYEVIRNSER